jgi:hypothetical protein
MISDDLLRMLKTIEEYDPDGGERMPTEADYVAHKTWAVTAYGADVWALYRKGNWAPRSDV